MSRSHTVACTCTFKMEKFIFIAVVRLPKDVLNKICSDVIFCKLYIYIEDS